MMADRVLKELGRKKAREAYQVNHIHMGTHTHTHINIHTHTHTHIRICCYIE